MFDEFQSQCTTSIPTIVGLIFYKIPWIISLHFAGQLGPEALAAAALATTLCNITGMSASVGLSSALMTLAGQAKGHLLNISLDPTAHHNNKTRSCTNVIMDEKKLSECDPLIGERKVSPMTKVEDGILIVHSSSDSYNGDFDTPLLPLIFLYRGIIVSLAIAFPIGLWWLNGVRTFLLLLGQSQKLSKMTSEYLQILVPGFWFYTINWTTNAWLQSIDMANVPAYSALIGLIFHIPTNLLFVNILGFGYKGVAMATVAFQGMQTLMIYSYLFCTNSGRDRTLESIGAKGVCRRVIFTWTEIKMALYSMKGIKQYLELGMFSLLYAIKYFYYT